MKKYTIEDLIIEVPESEKKSGKKNPIGKYTAIALLAIVLAAGIYIANRSADSSEDANISIETHLASETNNGNIQESNRNSLDNNITDTEKKELLDQIARKDQEMKKATEDLLITGNDTESLEPVTKESENNDTIINQNEKLLETKQGIVEPEAEETMILPTTQEENRSEQAVAGRESNNSGETASIPDTEDISAEKQIEISADQKPQKITDNSPLESTAIIAQEKMVQEKTTEKNRSMETIKVTEKDTGNKSESVAATTEEIPEQKEEKSQPTAQKPQGIADIIATEKNKDTAAKKMKPESKKEANPSVSDSSTYYIQIGVFNREPSEKYLSKIKKAGLNYLIVKSGKTRKVRVGPYHSSEQATHSISKVKEAIGIEGFVVKSATVPTKEQKREVAGNNTPGAAGSQENIKTETEKSKAADTVVQEEKNVNTADDAKKVKTSHKAKPKKSPIFSIFAKKPRYFVQVGKFRGNPPASLISRIKKARLRYTVAKSRNIRIVLIGPFKTYNSAKGAEGRINSTIGTHGFVVKSK